MQDDGHEKRLVFAPRDARESFFNYVKLFYEKNIAPYVQAEQVTELLAAINTAWKSFRKGVVVATRVIDFEPEPGQQVQIGKWGLHDIFQVDVFETRAEAWKYFEDNFIAYLSDPMDRVRIMEIFNDKDFRWWDWDSLENNIELRINNLQKLHVEITTKTKQLMEQEEKLLHEKNRLQLKQFETQAELVSILSKSKELEKNAAQQKRQEETILSITRRNKNPRAFETAEPLSSSKRQALDSE